MEMQPLSGMEDRFSEELLGDAAILEARAELAHARMRESSANRREYGAQIRQRAAEELRQMELQAQSEAEAAAALAEADAMAAQAEAAAAGARLAVSRAKTPLPAGWEVEEQVEHMRRAALREAAQQARRAAAERLEAARRAEAAALADSIARREEREIAEAQASVLREAAKYAEAEMRSRRKRYLHPGISVLWRAGDARRRLLADGRDHGEFIGLSGSDAPGDRSREIAGDSHGDPAGAEGMGSGAREGRGRENRVLECGQPLAAAEQWRPADDKAASEHTFTAEQMTVPPATRMQDVYSSGVSRGLLSPAPEMESRICEAPLEDVCWCEAESLIGCGYSKLGSALPREREPGKSADDGGPAMGRVQAPAADPSHRPRRSALKEALARASRDQTYDQPRHSTQDLPNNRARRNSPLLAIYSMAGGAGKTSLAANVARALASLGEKVLLVEATGQRLLPVYFGAGEVSGNAVRSFAPPDGGPDAAVSLISYDIAEREKIRGGSERDAHAGIFEDLVAHARRADRVIIDLGVSWAWIVARMAWMSPAILVPLAADINSVVSLKTVERSFNVMQDAEGRPLEPVYLLNRFDASMPLHREVREALRQRLGERLLPRAIRRSDTVSEALAEGMTVIDYDRASEVAQDYSAVAGWLRGASDVYGTSVHRPRYVE